MTTVIACGKKYKVKLASVPPSCTDCIAEYDCGLCSALPECSIDNKDGSTTYHIYVK